MTIPFADAAGMPIQWWQVTTGVIGIPTAIVALVYSIIKIPQARVDIEKARAEIDKTRAETAKLTKDLTAQKEELNDQKQQLDDVTLFLFNNFINEAELKHLENLESSTPCQFVKTGYAEDELRNLRDARLITILGGSVTKLPREMPDLHAYASLTETARYYLNRRRLLKNQKVV